MSIASLLNEPISQSRSEAWALPRRATLKKLVNRGDWDTIGKLFKFTPLFCDFKGRREFNWISAPPEMLNVLFGKPTPPQSKKKKSKKTNQVLLAWPKRQNERHALFGKQEGKCYYCGLIIEFEKWTIEHRIPLSRGGKWTGHIKHNKVGACYSCNHAKGNMTEDEFLATDYLSSERRAMLGVVTLPTIKYNVAKSQHVTRLARVAIIADGL